MTGEGASATAGSAEIRLLGPVDVRRGGVSIPVGGPRQRTVLVVLALNTGQVVPDEALAEAVWGDAAVDRSRGTLQVYVSNLRKLLAGSGGPVIERREPGYLLVPDAVDVDLDRFRAALDAGATALRRGDHLVAAGSFERALSECRGPFAADLEDAEVFAPTRVAIDERRLGAVEDLMDAKLGLGRHGELIVDLEGLLAENPYRERLWGQLMLALYRCGRQADALDTFQAARLLLVEELGVEPGPELRSIERDILEHSPSASAPDPMTPALHWVDDKTTARRYELDPIATPITIGRAPGSAVSLEWDGRVSRDHARLVHTDDGWLIVDDGPSKNGTWVNGERVTASRLLRDGDLVGVGETVVLVRLGTTRHSNAVIDQTTLTRGTRAGTGGL